MKHLLIIIVILYSVVAQSQNSGKEVFSGSFSNVTFDEFVEHFESETEYKFFFKREWIKNIEINTSYREISIEQLLDKILTPNALQYVVNNKSIIILPNKQFRAFLPIYQNAEINKTFQPNDSIKRNSQNRRFLEGRDPNIVKTIIIGSTDKARAGKKSEVTGLITEKETGEPLVGATLFISSLNKGVATNAKGICKFTLFPGTYIAVLQSMGRKEEKCVLKVISDGSFTYQLEKDLISINEVLITAEENKERGSRAGMEMISSVTIKELPTLMGEKNVMQIAQMLPGVVSVGEGSGGINVRGGSADQNLFYINDVPIYNSTHLFGFFSAVNSAIIDNFSIYKGQVPAEFGGRLSSVFSINTRDSDADRFFTQGGISPISAQASVETPIVKDKVSFMLSARSSYSDWILKQLDDPELKNSTTSFYDFAGSLNFKLKNNDKITLFAYNSSDKFTLNEVTDYEYSNQGASVNHIHRFSEKINSKISVLGSRYYYRTIDQTLASQSYEHDYTLNHYEIKAHFNWLPNEYHHIKYGLESILYQLDRGKISPYGAESVKEELPLGSEQGVESALFFDDNFHVNSRLKLNLGLRYSFFNSLGPQTVYQYAEKAPNSAINVIDSAYFEKNKIVKSYGGPEFRLAANYQLRSHNSIKLSFTQMRQYLFLLSNTVSITPYDQWKLADTHIKPPKSMQLSAGYFHDFKVPGLSFSSELYYKKAKDIVEYKDGADFLSTPHVESHILQGKQRAYGAEFMFQKQQGQLNGWASYTYSRSLIKVDGENDFEDINFGEEYPSNYDKPHVLNVLLNYKINKRFSFSSIVVYNTGRPITLPQGTYFFGGQPFVEYSKRNDYRIPDYFRIDMSVKIEGNLKRKKRFHSYWMASVYNLTGRKNANTVFFKSENGVINGYQYSVIGVPIFTLSWNWKLGNYANN